MTGILWVILPICIAIGAALIAVYIMQYRVEASMARERKSLAEARAALESQKSSMEELNRLREEAWERRSLESFLSNLRVETRRTTRERKMLVGVQEFLVIRERLYFRNLPLSNWVEHEAPLEDGADPDQLAKKLTVFGPDALGLAQPKRLNGVSTSSRSAAPNGHSHGYVSAEAEAQLAELLND